MSAIPLTANPVWRSYCGGRLLRRFRGHPDTGDNHFPEDWLASTVHARNGVHSRHPEEGLSQVQTPRGLRPLSELLEEEPGFWWGQTQRENTGVLWKLLDSSVRLQIQAHPDAQFARRHLGSNAGKTECWYILATRGSASVYLGFQNAPPREEWGRMIRKQQIEAMRSCFESIPVRPGDCFSVPAGVPHAIGEGVFMLEMQEPTDHVVRCEFTTAGLTLPPDSCFMGLDLDQCLEVFNYNSFPVEKVRSEFQQRPKTLRQSEGFSEEEIVSPEYHHFFRLHRLRGNGEAAWTGNELMLLIVVKGDAMLASSGGLQHAAGGQTWLLPGSIAEWKWLDPAEDWEILLAKLPTKTGR